MTGNTENSIIEERGGNWGAKVRRSGTSFSKTFTEKADRISQGVEAVTRTILSLIASNILLFFTVSTFAADESITVMSGGHELTGILCLPNGSGPFAAVVYHHGGSGDRVGGPPKETCRAISKAGYLGISLFRRSGGTLFGELEDANAAISYVKNLPQVDPRRIAVIGFSRGALLTWQLAARRDDLAAIVLMAIAVNPKLNFDDARLIRFPVLTQVARNDTGSSYTKGRDTVAFTRKLVKSLKNAGKDVSDIEYPAFGKDGHTLFFEVHNTYWQDVIRFLKPILD